MFNRKAGWIITPAHFGYISHYFNEGQMKALCGTSFTFHTISSEALPNCNPACKRCVKYLNLNGLKKK